jgi:deazaflavin-dependent oxidoreductase (nitroreductase family)
MALTQQIRSGFLNTLKHTLNPLTRQLAYTDHGPFVIIRHVGRRSGKTYETPIIARRALDGFVIELTYGAKVDWYKNVLAAGGCTVVFHGTPYVMNKIVPLSAEQGIAAFSTLQQGILRLLGRHQFVKLMEQK